MTKDALWPAPTAHQTITATVAIPGSKSITNRALILAALASSPSTIEGALISRDTLLMADALRQLGTTITAEGTTFHVEPAEAFTGGMIDCGLAGTVMRFVPPVAALAQGTVEFDGDPQARRRPMSTTLSSLTALGASMHSATGTPAQSLPFRMQGSGQIAGGRVVIDASASSQFVSGLLLAGARYDEGITVVHDGSALPSQPHVDMTVDMLRQAGVQVDVAENQWTVHPGPIAGRTWSIEPDLSNATPFMAAAAATGGTVRIAHWPEATMQPGAQFRDILQAMGASTEFDAAAGELIVTGAQGGTLSGLEWDMRDIGELTPTVAALAALAHSPSQISGIAHLRGHETDRLQALSHNINLLGGDVQETPDGLRITPAELHGGEWLSYADHRMATAGAILGLVTPGILVEDIGTTAKTLPDFPARWAQLLGEQEEEAHTLG